MVDECVQCKEYIFAGDDVALFDEEELLHEECVEQYLSERTRYGEIDIHAEYYRTYSRYLLDKKRRETWKETVRRSVEYNVGLERKHIEKIGYPVDYGRLRKEAQELFDSMFDLKQFLSGRTLWVGGAENGVADKYPLANFNCSFIDVRSWEDLGDLFYLLLVGTGVGFKATKANIANLSPICTNTTLLHSDYKPVEKHQRLQSTELRLLDNGFAKIYVGDSKEGWVQALRTYFVLLTQERFENIHTVKISYNSVRPLGERLKTFGGTASGHTPLQEMFDGIDKVLKNQIDLSLEPLEAVYNTTYSKVRPIHILDIGNLVGNNVVVGGVRRTAEIFLFDADDYESMFAKYGINGIWNEVQHRKVIALTKKIGLEAQATFLGNLPLLDANARPLHHRRMSNNSIAFEKQPSREFLNLVFEMMQAEGEPGFVNLEEARRRRPNAEGLNPCAEILLDSYGVCKLDDGQYRAVRQIRRGAWQICSRCIGTSQCATTFGASWTSHDVGDVGIAALGRHSTT